MGRLHWKYVLVGGGLASSSAAQAIRQRDTEGSILLAGQEVSRPYHRPALSKDYLLGQKHRPELFTVGVDWFVNQHIELRTGCRATRVDTSRRAVLFATGEEIAFDKLLIATGGSPQSMKIPGAELPNVYYLRTADHADRLHNAIEKAKAEGRRHERGRGRVVIVGANMLGVELASTLTQAGLAVDLLCAKPYPWSKHAGETTGRIVARYLEHHGVRVRMATSAVRFEGDGRVQRVITSDGETLECDFAIPALGMAPNKELVRATAITSEQAILVDSQCRTSVPDIYAAGDCAAILDPLFGKYRLLDHWDGAISTGALAGANMAGAGETYSVVNWFETRLFDLRASVWGEARLVERRIVRGNLNPETPACVEIGIAADGRVAQVIAVGHPDEDDVLRELVRRRMPVEGHEAAMRDPASRLEDLLE